MNLNLQTPPFSRGGNEPRPAQKIAVMHFKRGTLSQDWPLTCDPNWPCTFVSSGSPAADRNQQTAVALKGFKRYIFHQRATVRVSASVHKLKGEKEKKKRCLGWQVGLK